MQLGCVLLPYSGTWKSVHMWNGGKSCMGRRAFRKSNKSMQPGLKHHGAHYVEVLFLDPWQRTFLFPNVPNPHQDACAQLCPTILNIYPRMLNTMWTLIQTCTLIPTPFTRTCAYLRQPYGTPLTPDITNLPPGGNPIGTPTVKKD